jgi:hypothetical protein
MVHLQGQGEGEARPLARFQKDPPPQGLGEPPGQVEAQARAPGEALEGLKEPWPLFLGHPGAIVLHIEEGLPPQRLELQDNPAMGVADGVLQEVQEHLEDPVPVGEGLDRLMGQAAFQKHPPFPGQGGHQGQGLLGGLPQVQALKPQGNPRLDFGVGQDLFHQAGEAGRLLGQEAGEAPPLRLRQVRMGLQDLRQGPHRGEGGLELVGYGGQNLVLGLV